MFDKYFGDFIREKWGELRLYGIKVFFNLGEKCYELLCCKGGFLTLLFPKSSELQLQ
jgi:hypothetical protein